MNTTERSAMRAALDALLDCDRDGDYPLIDALRTALAAPAPEPVGWTTDFEIEGVRTGLANALCVRPLMVAPAFPPAQVVKVYASAPPQAPAPVDYFRVQEIAAARKIGYNELSAALRDYLASAPPQAQPDNRPCTCHPDDHPPQPCAKKYALAECKAQAPQPELFENLRIAGLNMIGLSEHDQNCDVFDLDDDGKHCECSCGLSDAIKTIHEAGKAQAPQPVPPLLTPAELEDLLGFAEDADSVAARHYYNIARRVEREVRRQFIKEDK